MVPVMGLALLASCNDAGCQQTIRELAALIAAVFIVIVIISVCFGAVMLTALVGGVTTSIMNVLSPSRRTRILGVIFGSLNLMMGMLTVLGVAVEPPRTYEPPEPVPVVEPTIDPNDPYAIPEVPATPAEIEHGQPELDLGALLGALGFGGFFGLIGLVGLITAIRAKVPQAAPPQAPAPRTF